MNTHFNTTNESGSQLHLFKTKAVRQQDIVLNFMRKHSTMGFTACDIYKALFDVKTPIISIRRSMSNLKEEGLIIKTNMKVLEEYGRPAYKYIYNSNKPL